MENFIYKHKHIFTFALTLFVSLFLFVTCLPSVSALDGQFLPDNTDVCFDGHNDLRYSVTYIKQHDSWNTFTSSPVKVTEHGWFGYRSELWTELDSPNYLDFFFCNKDKSKLQDANANYNFMYRIYTYYSVAEYLLDFEILVYDGNNYQCITLSNPDNVECHIVGDTYLYYIRFDYREFVWLYDRNNWNLDDYLQVVGVGFRVHEGCQNVFGFDGVRYHVNNGNESEVYVNSDEFDDNHDPVYVTLRAFLTPLKIALTAVLKPLFDGLDIILDITGCVTSALWDCLSAILRPLFNELLIPTFNLIVEKLGNIIVKISDVVTPIATDVVNFFAPYIEQIINSVGSVATSVIDRLSPIYDTFFHNISGSISGVTEVFATNTNNILQSLFIPREDSSAYIDFNEMQDEFTLKFPIFSQFKAFLTTLFNPAEYNAGLVRDFDCDTILSISDLTFDVVPSLSNGNNFVGYPTAFYSSYIPVNPEYTYTYSVSSDKTDFIGKQKFLFFYNENYVCIKHIILTQSTYTQSFTCPANARYVIFRADGIPRLNEFSLNVYAYKQYNSGFIVNVFGHDINVLDFSWYMPYKHLGDICIIAFCYLAFIWSLFKKLPSLI